MGIYVALGMAKNDAEIMHDFVKQLGLKPMPVDMYHISLVRAKGPDVTADNCPILNDPITLSIDPGSYYFYSSYEKGIECSPSIRLRDNRAVRDYRKQAARWVREQGFKPRTDGWVPHTTLSYGNAKASKVMCFIEDQRRVVSIKVKTALERRYIPLPFEQLTFDRIILDVNNKNWVEENGLV